MRRALDLFSGAGGATRGLVNAGFDVVAVDHDCRAVTLALRAGASSSVCGDVFTFLNVNAGRIRQEISLVWASPPCQRYSTQTSQHGVSDTHPDLIAPVRERLEALGVPYVIENVPRAPIRRDLMLCGKFFGLDLARHRHFELGNWPDGIKPIQPDHTYVMDGRRHEGAVVTVTGNTGGSSTRDGASRFGGIDRWREAMGIDWMPAKYLREAIPPDYSEYIARALKEQT